MIFTSQPNLVVDFGIHPSLHENCHHQIVYSKFDLKIFYSPPYERTVWHYQQANTELTKRSLESFDWKNAFSNCNPNEQVYVLTKTLLNIMSNFIPNETILVDDRDPPWITRKLKSMIQEKNLFYKKYLKPNNQEKFQAFSQIQERVRLAIEDSKKKYYKKLSNKLSNDKFNGKCYWTILKRFFNGKRIPCIPPILNEDKFVTDFQVKSEIFNSHFAKKCSLLKNESQIPPQLLPHGNTCLSTVRFSENDILKVIRKLDPNKAHGYDKISIRMLKLSDKAICKPLHMIFISCLETGVFSIHWKKANVVPIHKKKSKQLVKNHRPVSLLPICGKAFERLIYNEVYPYLIDNNLISSHQSGFKGGDSCINQLLSITHEIYKSFDEGFEVSGVFLDISKAFDRVWHDGLIFKLQENGICGK